MSSPGGPGYDHRVAAATGAGVPKVLIVSNDFPPRRGGIQSFVHALAVRMPAGSVVVYAPVVGRGGGVRRQAAVPGDQAPDLADAAGAVGGPARGGDPARSRLRHGPVRGGGPARAARPVAAPGRGRADGRPHARSRGGLGGAARRPGPCCAGSATRLTCSPTWVSTSGSGWPGPCHPRRRPGWCGSHPGWTPPRSAPGRTGTRSGSGSAWAAGRWSSACRGWSSARARTR